MRARAIVVIGLALLTLAAAQRSTGDAQMQAIMRSKLANTQSILKAIVTSDFTEIDRSAQALSRISEMEIVSWQSPPRPEYTAQAVLFLSSVQGLRDAARQRNLAAVGDEYSSLVSTCIHCHTYVRDSRRASASMRLTPLMAAR